MMYKYVLIHQPNLVSLYALGHLHAPRQPLPLGEAAGRRLKAYPVDYWGATDQDPTWRIPHHGASGSPPDPALDSPQKAAPGSPPAVGSGSPLDLTSVSPLKPASGPSLEPASVSRPAGLAGARNPASHYKSHMAQVHTGGMDCMTY